jgi:hypothetical protein
MLAIIELLNLTVGFLYVLLKGQSFDEVILESSFLLESFDFFKVLLINQELLLELLFLGFEPLIEFFFALGNSLSTFTQTCSDLLRPNFHVIEVSNVCFIITMREAV